MKDKLKGILFSTPMVDAINEDRKTMTRREMKIQPSSTKSLLLIDNTIPVWKYQFAKDDFMRNGSMQHGEADTIAFTSPYQPGDILYVRETFWQFGFWYYPDFGEGSKYDNAPEWRGFDIKFVADAPEKPTEFPFKKQGGFWRKIPSIHMPKALARTFLRVTAVKAERLNEISEADAIAEGIENMLAGDPTVSPVYLKYGVSKKEMMALGGHWAHCADGPIESFKSLWESINGPGTFDERYVFAYTFEKTDKPA
jgi:hypothetical protein